METSLRSGRFTISFPGPTLAIKDGGMTGLNIHELRELGDLIQASLDYAGSKREPPKWDKGSPSQDGDLSIAITEGPGVKETHDIVCARCDP